MFELRSLRMFLIFSYLQKPKGDICLIFKIKQKVSSELNLILILKEKHQMNWMRSADRISISR